jgi:hypothetical protein
MKCDCELCGGCAETVRVRTLDFVSALLDVWDLPVAASQIRQLAHPTPPVTLWRKE